jgi:hypothetical protein
VTDWAAAIDKIKTLITGQPIPADQPRNVAMNDIQTSPSTPTLEKFIPLFLQPLAQRYAETNDDDVSPTCEWLGIPVPETLPTPGQAKTWHKDEWSEWSKNNGFEFTGETTHSWTWKHPLVNSLVISVAKTPGDFRTPMAMATQTRRAVREFAVGANVLLRALAKKGFHDAIKDIDEKSLKEYLVGCLQSKDEQNHKVVMGLQQQAMEEGKLSKTLTDLVNVLGRITKDFNIPASRVLSQLLNCDAKGGQEEWERMKLFAPDHPIGASMVAEAKDYLEALRDNERAEIEEKRAERDRDLAEREEKRLAKLRPKTSRQVLQEMIDQQDDLRLKGIRGCMTAAISTIDRLRTMEAQLSKSMEVPEIEDPAMKAEIAAKDQKIKMVEEVLKERDQELDRQKLRIGDLEIQVAQVTPERLTHLNGVEAQMHALASLVVSTIEEAKKGNSFQMVEALNNLVAEAKHFLPQEQMAAST